MSDNFKFADLSLAEAGKLKIEWAKARMTVLMALREKYRQTKPLAGHRVAVCLHGTQ